MLRLVYLPANQAWAFVFGNTDALVDQQLVAMHNNRLLYNLRIEAVEDANRRGLEVDKATGVVRPAEWAK